jgi:sensor histidine kinase YesM
VSAAPVPLDAPLPDDIGAGWLRGVLRYRRWPVFSARWLVGRALVFGAVLLLLAALSALGTAVAGPGLEAGLIAGAWLFGSMMLMAFAGPVLAGFVRYARWPLQRERAGVVLAVLVGIGFAYAVDRVGSARIDAQIRPAIEANSPGLAESARQAEARANEPWMKVAGVGIALGIYFALGGGLALGGYVRESRQWEHARQQRAIAEMAQARREAELRLAVLQAQVEPHFLFNTLASIRALVRSDSHRAEATLDALSAHLRTTMPAVQAGTALPESTLSQQLAVAESYLEVMRLRLGGRLSVCVDADAEARAQPFPPLLLITLVENAIKHGIEPKRGPGEVRIEARREGAQLVIEVLDDGVGLNPGLGGGVGLANVRAQLAAAHGEAASLDVAARAVGGCAARLRLPWRESSVA